jgi:uncharacterized protein HemY
MEVHLQPAKVGAGVRQSTELAGLITVLLEAGLSELPGVMGVVDGVPPAPGFVEALRTGAELWSGRIEASAAGEDVRYRLTLCDPSGACSPFEHTAAHDGASAAASALLGAAAEKLGIQVSPEQAEAWAKPQSLDPYAVLLCGRAAAVFYGLRAPVEEAFRGDRRKDPLARAVYVDPAMPLAWWVVGRSAFAREAWGEAREAFTRGVIARPSVPVMAAEAAALFAGGRAEAAWSALVAVDAQVPGDPRLAVLRARAALGADQVQAAVQILDALPTSFQDERPVAELRVAIAEVTGKSSNYDELLERWQRAAPNDPEPVRRRVKLRVDDGRWEQALALTDVLAERGAGQEAAERAMGIAVGLGRYDVAEHSARELGLTEVAARIRARAALEAKPAEAPPELEGAADPIASLALAESALARGDAEAALEGARRSLKVRPWFPEALALEARALEALGRAREAAEASQRLARVEPGYQVPVAAAVPQTAPGSSGSAAQVQAETPKQAGPVKN